MRLLFHGVTPLQVVFSFCVGYTSNAVIAVMSMTTSFVSLLNKRKTPSVSADWISSLRFSIRFPGYVLGIITMLSIDSQLGIK